MKRRVVVTGMGAITPLGHNVKDTWNQAIQGKNGIDFITLFDASNMRVKIAAEVKNLDPADYLDSREAKRLDRTIIFGLIAAQEAYRDSGLDGVDIDRDRFGVYVTSGIGGLGSIWSEAQRALEKGSDRVSPYFIPNAIVNLVGGHIAIKFKAYGANIPVVTACSAGTNAIGEAFRAIRDGYLDLALTGGSEAAINEFGVGGFTAMKALNFSNDPNRASIPFDRDRSGFVMGEGSGVLLLEEYEHAKRRGAKIYAEVVGYGTSCDAYHITAPDESARGITEAIRRALQDAGIEKENIGYINAHGTSTPYNDRLETLGIKQAFGEHAYRLKISSTKSMTGHALGAVGGIEAILTIKALEEQIIPPTINLLNPDPECDLDYTPNQAVKWDFTYAMSNSIGFGGQNAVVIFKKWEEM
ncbi:MAG TPA: beta-ketoacyl-ACP synthase II [Haloplasmataceae bacterium]